jgi:crotonobetainyl-CoA:carnitine CoA-transferase CaiB-like acyl-CoA transferase
MPARVSAWAIYELFTAAEGKKIFIGIVSDAQWVRFCKVFGLPDLAADPRLMTNNGRISERGWLIPKVAELAASLTASELESLARKADIAFAVVAEPADLLHNRHLVESDGLLATRLSNGGSTLLPRLPLRMDGRGFDLRNDPPRIGDAARDLLGELGYGAKEIEALAAEGIISVGEDP